jgi:hypothetical protein
MMSRRVDINRSEVKPDFSLRYNLR